MAGDVAFIQALQEQGFACAEDEWRFSLPALHAWLTERLPGAAAVSYAQFCQELFASEINQRLRQQGAEIAIADNRGKISLSLYCLRRLPA
ncbi:hypothetical protein A9179_11455 [Pseudomonas alcaligenes]|uniref:Uncharacterized protein n=1 Tax=Aquipseudomonas alcaligenes TaxID=43263 RepID=A0ABR7S1G7_AQUAC|nr:hypothetical protein [Pseudomonas alcaligenes]